MKLPVCHRDGCRRTVTKVAWRNEHPPFCSRACYMRHHEAPGWEAMWGSQELSDRVAGRRKAQNSRYAA